MAGLRRRRGPLRYPKIALAGALGAGLMVVEHQRARQWRAGGQELVDAGLALPHELEHRFVAVSDGGRVHAAQSGQGPPVVLVHGVTLSMATWALQVRSLSTSHRVIIVDQRGHGQSLAGSSGFSMERMGQDVLEVLQALEVEQAVLVGHSMGGMVSLALAVHHPHELARRVRALLLVATSAGPVAPRSVGSLPQSLLPVARRVLTSAERHGAGLVPQGDLATWLARLSFGRDPAPAHIELTRSMIASMSPLAMAGILEPLLGYDVRSRLEAVSLPTTVLVGTRDVLTPPPAARLIARRIPGAALSLLEGCGHMVMLERPAHLARAISEMTLVAATPTP